MSDCEIADPSLPIRQGDVLKLISPGQPQLLLVITADCDIAHFKFGDAGLACVGLVPISEYVLSDVARSQAERRISKRVLDLTEWIDKWRVAADPMRVRIQPNRVRSWIREDSLEMLEKALALVEKSSCTHLRKEVSAIKAAEESLLSADRFAAIDALCLLQLKPTSREDQISSVVGAIDPRNLPVDTFFVSTIPGESGLGYIAKLRAISFVPFEMTSTSMAAAKELDVAYLRLGRLGATFRHGLAQQFGMLFARIGFPISYEGDREAAFAVLADELKADLEKQNG